PHRLRTRRVQPRRHGAPGWAAAGRAGAARSGAAAQRLHSQRSVQFYPSGDSGGRHERRLKPGSPEAAEHKKWLTERYHAPSDDLDQPVDLVAAGKFEDIVQDLAVKVADDPQRPRWDNDSFFRRFVVVSGTGR